MSNLDLEKPWGEHTFVAFDTETSGKYPLSAQICEIGAVKWQGGKEVERFERLIKPDEPMKETVIKIHGITNEMVADAPKVHEVIGEFSEFIRGAVTIAHHAPFDLGFLAPELEYKKIELPDEPVICSSLLSRRVIPTSPNHRLQTLVEYLGLEQGTAHRAGDDAAACLRVTIECMNRLGPLTSLKDVLDRQGGAIQWSRFSIDELMQEEKWRNLLTAIENKKRAEMIYSGGSRPGRSRIVYPEGLVRSLNGDFLVAKEEGQVQTKRYYLEKVKDLLID